MRIEIIGKNLTVTEGIKGNIESKLKKLNTFLKEDTSVRVIIRTVKEDQIIEVTINENGIVRAEARDKDLYNAIKEVEEKLVRILRKRKEKRIEKHRNQTAKQYNDESEADLDIVKHKELCLPYLRPEDAIFALEAVDHTFYVYRNAETETVEIVYKRQDGKYGVITEKDGL